MPKLFIFFAFLIFLAVHVQAAVKFNCYALNTPVQAIEAGRVNCGAHERKDLKENTATTVTCLYQSICEVLAPGEKPTVLTSSDINGLTMNGTLSSSSFKMSAVTCRGDGVLKNGHLISAKCKAPKECQDDVLFNMAMTLNVGPYENSTVDVLNMNKSVEVRK